MKTLFLDSTLSFITKYKNYTDEEVSELRYGLEGIYLTITKLVIVVALAIILNIFKQVVSLLILFNIIRYLHSYLFHNNMHTFSIIKNIRHIFNK